MKNGRPPKCKYVADGNGRIQTKQRPKTSGDNPMKRNTLITILVTVALTLVANCANAAVGTGIRLEVNNPVVFTTEPQDQTAVVGDTVTYQVVVSAASTAPFTYQWEKDTVAISGQTTSTLVLTNVQTTDNGNYRCRVSNVVGEEISASGLLTVGNTLSVTITSAPEAVGGIIAINPGEAIGFDAIPNDGHSPYSFQWRRNGVDIVGATGSAYDLTGVTSANDGEYTCRVTDTNSVAVVSTGITVAVNVGVEITTQPATTINVVEPQGFTISITATGTNPEYQWTHNGVDIAGATNNSFTLASATPANGGVYRCRVSNMVNSITSNACSVNVNGVLTVTIESTPQYEVVGTENVVRVNPTGTNPPTSVLFTATASGGTPPYTYRWTKDAVDVAGGTNSTLTVLGAEANEGVYNCDVQSAPPAKSAKK
jgi:hypothetical protein